MLWAANKVRSSRSKSNPSESTYTALHLFTLALRIPIWEQLKAVPKVFRLIISHLHTACNKKQKTEFETKRLLNPCSRPRFNLLTKWCWMKVSAIDATSCLSNSYFLIKNQCVQTILTEAYLKKIHGMAFLNTAFNSFISRYEISLFRFLLQFYINPPCLNKRDTEPCKKPYECFISRLS